MGTGWVLVTAATAFVLVAAGAVFVPGLLRSSSSTTVVALVGAGAVLGALAPGEPTHLAVLDVVLRGAFGAAVVVAAAWAGPKPRLGASLVVVVSALLGSGASGAIPAALAVGVCVAVLATGVDGAVLAAAVGLGVGQAALRLDWPSTTGLTALLALVALMVLAVPALLDAPTRGRRRLGMALGALGAVAIVLVGAYAVLVVLAKGDIDNGVDAANAGLEQARLGHTVRAAREFDVARQAFADAHDTLDAWWGKGALAVPIASEHARALDDISAIGVQLSTSGASAARAADPAATELTDGIVPIAKIAALERPLSRARRSLLDARVRLRHVDATWLVAPLDDKISSLEGKVTRAAHDAETGVEAARVVPAMLGAGGQTRRYFVAFQTPAEQRANGGIIGSFAVVSFTDGRLHLDRTGRDGDLNTEGSTVRTLTGPPDYLARYAQFDPQYVWQNVTMSPDWPSVAQVIGGLYPQSGGGPVDGAISVDPTTLAAFLKLTGPVAVDGLDRPLTAKNAARILLRDQYVQFPDQSERVDFLGDSVRAVVDRIEHGNLPGAGTIGHVLGPMVKEGRLKLQAADLAVEHFFTRIRAGGAFPPVHGDFAGLVTQNAAGNKIDLFLHRSLRYDVSVDPATGTEKAVATIVLRNDSPSTGLPDSVIAGLGADPTAPGQYRGYLSFYTPLAFQQAEVVSGTPARFTTQRELGRNVVSAFVDIDPGSSDTIRIELAGPVHLPRGEDVRYGLTVWHQPTIDPDLVAVHVSGPGGRIAWDGRPSTDRRLGVDLNAP